MPVISVLPFDASIISLSAERSATRSVGVHLSRIIRDRLITAGIVRSATTKGWSETDKHLTFQKGYLWEQMLGEYLNTPEWQRIEWDFFASRHLRQAIDDSIEQSGGHIVRPGEQLMDGIYMTPDAVNLRAFCIEEWKATTIRAKNLTKLEERKPEWLWQGAAYARKFNFTRAIFRVFHLAENPPLVQQFVVEWTSEEIEKNWSQLLRHYQDMRKAGRAI